MASIDLSDPHISMAHDALLHNDPLRWFLLAYGNSPNVLVLSASGTGDVDELCAHLTPENVCYGVFREQTQDKFLHVLLNYIPDSVKGVWRARALVHGKAVSSKFKVHQVLNVSNPDQITIQALRTILRLPPRVTQDSSSTPLGADGRQNTFSVPRKPTPDIRSALNSPPGQARFPGPLNETPSRSTSLRTKSSRATKKHPFSTAAEVPSTVNGPPPLIMPSPSSPRSVSPPPVANFVMPTPSESISNTNQPHSPLVSSPVSVSSDGEPRPPLSPQQASWLAKREAPLPLPPPSDNENGLQDADRTSVKSDGRPDSSHMGSIPDSNSIMSLHTSDLPPSPEAASPIPLPPSEDVSTGLANCMPSHVIDGLPVPSLAIPPVALPQAPSQGNSDRIAVGSIVAEDPTEVATLKKLRSKFQERVASTADAEEERKLIVLDEERRRRSADRVRREKAERAEEEAREKEFEERKEREKKRRLESARKAEEQRAEQKRQKEEEEARQKAEKEQREEEIRQRRKHIQQRFEKQTGMDLLSGFITLESSGSWRRRYYKLSTEDWIFFKSDKDITAPIHALELSRVRALREWHEGYDELEAIPNSFAVELEDDAPCLFFADSAEDKEILLGLLNQAAGL